MSISSSLTGVRNENKTKKYENSAAHKNNNFCDYCYYIQHIK